jgi:WD40-like Beta Propeller Repeat
MRFARIYQTFLMMVLLLVVPAWAQEFGPWSAPVELGPPVNDGQADWQPAISPDGLSLYVVKFCAPGDPNSCNPNDAVMWVFRRATKGDPWGSPEQLPSNINVAGKNKAVPYISPDGHWMYFSSNRTPNFGGADLWRSYRNNTTMDSGADGWQTPANLGPNVNSGKNEQMGCIFTDDTTGVATMYFSSNRAQRPDPNPGSGAGVGGFANDIYASTLQPDGSFGSVTPVQELNDPLGSQQNPTCSRDGLEMYFASDRPGSILYPVTPDDFYGPSGMPSPDIWVSTRTSTAAPWRTPQTIDEFNASHTGSEISSQFHDGRPSLSLDGTELYFFTPSWRTGCEGPTCWFNVYVISRVRLYVFNGFLSPLSTSRTEFKLGSTIPVKWQLQDQDGNYVNRLSAVESLKVLYNGTCSEDDGTALNLSSSGDTGLRYDSDGSLFIFNWQTKGLSPGCYSIVLTLDDATIHSVPVSLK